MAARKKKKSAQKLKRKGFAPGKTKRLTETAPLTTVFPERFRTIFLGGPSRGWPLTLPFNRTAARVEIPLMLRVMMEVSDGASIPSDVPSNALRTKLESFLTAENWLKDRMPGVPPPRVRHKEMALVAGMLMRFYHLGNNSGGSTTGWPPPPP